MKNNISSRKAWLIITGLLTVGLCMGAVTQISLTTQVSGILPGANGGSGNGFFAISGPATTLKTFTLPNSNATIEFQANKDAASGYAGLDGSSKLAAAELPNPSSSTLGGVESLDCTGSGHIVKISTSGVPTCSSDSAGPNFADAETPSGSVNSSNVTFTLAHTPNPSASLLCAENGVQQIAGGADFTLSTGTITYGVAPPTGATIRCYYRY